MTDREQRLRRALVLLTTAEGIVDRAANDVIVCMQDKAETISRLAGRIRWMAAQVRRELRNGD